MTGNIFRQLLTRTPSVKKNQKLLDLCCGTGQFSWLGPHLGYATVGVDLSPDSIACARERMQSFTTDIPIEFVVNDAYQYLDSHPQSFDVIWMLGSLYYFDVDQLMPKILRALKPGGQYICVEVSGSQSLARLVRRVKHSIKGHRDQASLQQLLTIQQAEKLAKYFAKSELKYFDFFSFASGVGKKSKWIQHKLFNLTTKMDEFIIHRLQQKQLGFRFIFSGQIT